MNMKWVLILVIVSLTKGDNLRKEEEEKKGVIVNIINHSHIDPGWRKTFSAYYYGRNYDVDKGHRDDRGGVRNIFRSILSELAIDSTKKFVIGEMAYFKLYYDHAADNLRALIRQYLAEERLEVAGGGWVMPDEAVTYYDDIIDQFMLGHEFLRKTFNKKPIVAWQLDNFGFSAGCLQLFYEMGFKVLYGSRVDYEDKAARHRRNAYEFIWAPSLQGRDTPMLMHILHNYYMQPSGYWYDLNVKDTENHEPIRDSNHLMAGLQNNLQQRAEHLVGYFRNEAQQYERDQVMHLLGNDFSLTSNGQAYENYDRIIHFINAKQRRYNLTIQHSLPQTYFHYLHQNLNNKTYEVKTGDFFPFRNGQGEFWSGYYTTRPNFKYLCRVNAHYLHSVRNLIGAVFLNAPYIQQQINQTLINNNNNSTINNNNKVSEQLMPFLLRNRELVQQKLYELEEAISLMQHHDAITGTAYQKVFDEYSGMIWQSRAALQSLIDRHLKEELQRSSLHNERAHEFVHCSHNETSTLLGCPLLFYRHSQAKPVLLTVFNQRNHPVTLLLQVKVTSRHTFVVDVNNKPLDSEVFCLNPFDAKDCLLNFVAPLQPFRLNYFKLTIDLQRKPTHQVQFDFQVHQKQEHKLKLDDFNYLHIHPNLQEYQYMYCGNKNQNSLHCHKIVFRLEYGNYLAWENKDNGQKDSRNHNSGSYVYHPDPHNTFKPEQLEKATFHLGTLQSKLYLYGHKGRLQAVLTFNLNKVANRVDNILDWKQVEIESIIDPLDTHDKGKEFILRIKLDWTPSSTFYTDRNGLDLQQRVIDYKEGYNITHNVAVSSNMYPITTCLQLYHHQHHPDPKLSIHKLSIFTDRPIAAGSHVPGIIELLLQRKHRQNDGKGIAQPLQETDQDGHEMKVRQVQTLLFQLFSNEQDYHRLWQYNRDTFPTLFFSATSSPHFHLSPPLLSPSLHSLLNNSPLLFKDYSMLRVWYLPRKDNTTFLRIINMNDHKTINVSSSQFPFIQEMSLQGNRKIEEMMSLHKEFDYKEYPLKDNITLLDDNYHEQQAQWLSSGLINLLPLQIRTFLVGFSSHQLHKWAAHYDQPCPEMIEYYQEDPLSQQNQYFTIDLSKFGGNATNATL